MRSTAQPDELTLPAWADWNASRPYTVGVEEEVMLLHPRDWSLAQRVDEVLPRLSPDLASQVSAETHRAVIELATRPHDGADACAREMSDLRVAIEAQLAPAGLRAASAGTHPFALWTDTEVSRGARQQRVYGSMRELARREPTFALHVHVGVVDPEAAIALHGRLRNHLPLLLALSVNSPFWQGRDTGLCSSRTPLFQAFPRVGIPRAFASYDEYVEAVDLLLRCDAFPDPTFLWWDVRPQPRFGTVEVRIMDAQSTVSEAAALVALVQTIAHLELAEGYLTDPRFAGPEVLAENRFLAARDGLDARLLDPVRERRVPARELLARLLEVGRPHAIALGCEGALQTVLGLAHESGARRQRRELEFGTHGLPGVVKRLSDLFTNAGPG